MAPFEERNKRSFQCRCVLQELIFMDDGASQSSLTKSGFLAAWATPVLAHRLVQLLRILLVATDGTLSGNPQQLVLHKEARSNGALQDFHAPPHRDGLIFSDGSTPQAYLGRTDNLIFLEDGTP